VFVRFVCFNTVEGQRTRLGLFQAIELARQSDHAAGWAMELVNELNAWFSDYLAVPAPIEQGWRETDGQRPLSWFKPEAAEHIRRMHELKAALEECRVHIDVLTTRDLGQVVWQDQHQVLAAPKGRKF
jgi:hypothetical protein